MTKYHLTSSDTDVSIEVTEVGDKQQRLLEAFAECQEGHCSCPTEEYEKVAAMEIESSTDGISIKLQAKPGTDFDTSELSTCLAHTVAKADEAT